MARPVYSVFAGVPTPKDGNDRWEIFKTLSSGYSVPTVIVQNRDERFIHPDALEAKLGELHVPSVHVVVGEGTSHKYPVEQMRREIERMCTRYQL